MSESDFRSDDARAEADLAAERDAGATAGAAGPVDEDDALAAEGLRPSPDVARHYREMTERGAHQAGEGRVP